MEAGGSASTIGALGKTQEIEPRHQTGKFLRSPIFQPILSSLAFEHREGNSCGIKNQARPSHRSPNVDFNNPEKICRILRMTIPLVTTQWLAKNLQHPLLRVFDCTVYLHPANSAQERPYRIESGKNDYLKQHIPGAGFLDLPQELSDQTTSLRFMLPDIQRFATTIAAKGVSEQSLVILYSHKNIMWATRLWWMFRAFGFNQIAVLDGGFDKWLSESRPISAAACCYPPAKFTARPRKAYLADKDTVLTAIDDRHTYLVNALSKPYFLGHSPSRYGRPGRIPGSISLPAKSLLDKQTHTFLPLVEIEKKCLQAGIPAKINTEIIAYCGGGISATLVLFLLHRLGYRNLSLYDGSMGEWAADHSLPIEQS